MHIGLIPEQSASTGGSYIYSRFLLDAALQAIRRDQDHQAWVFIDKAGEVFRHLADAEFRQAAWLDPPGERLKRVLQQTPYLKPARMAYHGLRRIAGSPAARRIDPEKPRYASTRHRRLRQLGIEAAIYTYPTSSAFENQIPYVMPIHDLQHRLQPQFPEVSAGREWEHREYLYRNAIRFGTTILADSQVGKEDILNCYPEYASPECIEVLPYPPIQTLAVDDVESERERVRGAFGLPERFFFYPAQFWPHKNHLRIVQALALIRDRHRVAIELVLSGTHSGKLRTLTFQEVMTEAHRLGVDEQVKYLGYVADRDVAALYVTARAGNADFFRTDQHPHSGSVGGRMSRPHFRYSRCSRTSWRRRAAGRSDVGRGNRRGDVSALDRRATEGNADVEGARAREAFLGREVYGAGERDSRGNL